MRKKVAQNYDIDMEEDIPDSPVYRRLQEKIQMLEDERDFYQEQYDSQKIRIRSLEEQIKLLQEQEQLDDYDDDI
jgi:polyhydroxyalkanoate synthesis regulator phasin